LFGIGTVLLQLDKKKKNFVKDKIATEFMLVCLTKSVTASKKHEPRNGPYFDFVLSDSIGRKVSGQQA
jgi:hypothetical protein